MDRLDFWNLSGLSDEHLLRDLEEFVAGGARAEARVVAHLAEVEERRLHLKAAYSSLFDYCLRGLKLSESEAFHRITAARLARRFPVIFGLLAARSIHLSALRVLRDHLSHDNHRELLAAASGKSTKEVEALVAAIAPRPDVAPLIRKLPTKRGALATSQVVNPVKALASESAVSVSPRRELELGESREHLAGTESGARSTGTEALEPHGTGGLVELTFGEDGERPDHSDPPARRSPRERMLEPLSSSRYLLRVSVSRELTEKLERARNLMSHANPNGDLGSVLERALDVLVEKLEKQRFAQTKRPMIAQKGALDRQLRRAEDENGESQYRESALPSGGENDEAGNGCPSASRDGDENARTEPSTEPDRAPHASPRVGHARRHAANPVNALSRPERARREHISNDVRRAVAIRDRFQCTYVDDEGHRCPSRAFLELHHEWVHARGGPSMVENLRLLCAPHNRLLAERDFGRTHQEQFTQREPKPRSHS